MTAPGPRLFRAADVGAIVRLWNESAAADPTTTAWFTRSVLLDRDFDPDGLLVVERGGRVAGCCYAARRRGPVGAADPEATTGWIVFLFVHPDHRREGIAASLIRHGLSFLARHGCTVARLASLTPHYVAPGLDEAAYPAGRGFLENSGFGARGEVVAMGTSLLGVSLPAGLGGRRAQLEAAGYRFGRPADGELPQLIEFAARTFSADWGEALREVLTRAHDARPVTTVHLGDKVLGFAAHSAYRGIGERFGPFGVDPGTRGLGLGRLLLIQALTDMRSEGLQNAWFLWTEEDSAAAHLYRQTGFSVSRRFSLWDRPL